MTDSSAFPLSLFATLMRDAPAQPATNLWRAQELKTLIDLGLSYIRENRDILDLGCGDGGVMAALLPYLPRPHQLVGVDPDPDETRLAEASGLYARIITCGAEQMPLESSSIDVVISNSVLEHIPPVEEVLKETTRILRSGGWFIATVPGPNFHRCLRGAWLPWVKREDYEREIDTRLAHLRYWTKTEWQLHLEKAGLTLVQTTDYLPLKTMRRWELLSWITGGLLYHLMGKRKPPIKIQRDFNMRRRIRVPRFVIQGMAWLLSRGLSDQSGPYGGLLVIGRKP